MENSHSKVFSENDIIKIINELKLFEGAIKDLEIKQNEIMS